MIVLIHATGEFPDLQFVSPEWEGVQAYAVGELQDFASRLYRDPDAMGLLYCHLPDMAPQIVRGLRDGNVENRLLILLRERGSESSRAGARALTLMAGADDAQPDTIDPLELVARLRVINVRTRQDPAPILIAPAVLFDPLAGSISADEVLIHLTRNETALLELLTSRAGSCVTKEHCMEVLYGGRDEPQAKILDVFLCKLRRKLRSVCGGRDVISTVWGKGYRFEPDGAAA